jgi:hypothetical protein
VSVFATSQADQSRWQRRAAAELSAILQAHPGLPIIAWTVCSAGAKLVGRVNGLAPASDVRAVYEIWRTTLSLTEHREHATGSATYLNAATNRDRVRLALSATAFDEESAW